MSANGCVFCSILDGATPAAWVLDDDADVAAFLDMRPVFKGHVLVVPRQHHETLLDLPDDLIPTVFEATKRVAAAVVDALGCDGTFVAMNNVVSQSVPHLHVHVVPRNRKDGLRGFFWPRTRYEDEAAMEEAASRVRSALD